MDHIVKLSDSEGFDTILIVICRLTKQALFIPCHTTDTAPDFAKLFLKHIFSKHRLPDDIVSDHRPLFVSYFWQLLCKALEIKTSLSTAYHPETDGQTKCINQTLEQYLHLYVNYLQNNWRMELPLAEFTYNTPHSATGVSPFYANKSYNPRLTLSLKDIPSHVAHEVAEDLRSLHQFLWDEINTANQAYSKHTNARRKPTPNWPPGTVETGSKETNHKALLASPRPPRWQAIPPAAAPSPPPPRLPQRWNPAGSPAPLSLLPAALPPPLPLPTPANAPSAPPTPADKTITPQQSRRQRPCLSTPSPVPSKPRPTPVEPRPSPPVPPESPPCGGPPLPAHPAPAYWDPPWVKGTLSISLSPTWKGPPPSPQSPSPTPCPSALPPVALQPNLDPTLALPQRRQHANSGLLKFTLLPSSGARRTLQGHVGPGNIKLSSHSPGPPPDTTQGWGDPLPNPPPRQTALASPPPVPPSNPLGQAGPPPDKCQTWST
ncbi:hypothetical protein E4T56_gene1388 [Termitomyces sp. T112]|nr:hypothetical protein E4T56_gene1388 [Termitomyces sp. T112]